MPHAPRPSRTAARPIPRMHRVTARLLPGDYDRLCALAEQSGTPLDELAAEALTQWLAWRARADREAGERQP